MKTILLTGFEPFGGELSNPSWELARALDGQVLSDGSLIRGAQLPCEFGRASEVLATHIHQIGPQIVLCLGQAGGRAEISIERVAINLNDARIADNAGAQPIDTAVLAGGPAAYFSTLPVKAIAQALRENGIPAAISHSAGTYVCNQVFYSLMHLAAQQATIERAGFVHIPYLPQQAAAHPGAPSMRLALMLEGIVQVLETSVTVQIDSSISGGTLY